MFTLARTIVTVAVVLTLAYRYGLATDGFFGWVDAVIVEYGLMAIVTSIVLVVLAGVYVLAVPPGRRRPRLVRLFLINGQEFTTPGPLSVLALAGATTGVVAWSMNAIGEYDNAFVSLVTGILVLLPAAVFLLFAPLSVAGTIFNAANAHPTLPALAAPFVTVGAIVMDRFSGKIIATPDNLKDPFALLPQLHRVLVTLECSADRCLPGPAVPFQQPPHRRHRQAHPQTAADHRLDPGQSPAFVIECVRRGTLAKFLLKHGELGVCDGRGVRRAHRAQGLHAALAPGPPAAFHRPHAHPEIFRDHRRLLARRDRFPA
ncbi:hypothetical protein OG237_42525 (plasmid) [Streptomyces zaomyceticus]|nr:hypothetical protein OG237_42525 [Streptomyces zaomyceticus]